MEFNGTDVAADLTPEQQRCNESPLYEACKALEGLIKACGHFFTWTASNQEAFTALLFLQTISRSLKVVNCLLQQTSDLFVNLFYHCRDLEMKHKHE